MTLWLKHIPELRNIIAQWRTKKAVIGLVPTMGDLHDGHLSLVKAAQAACDKVIVTIFINPAQFDCRKDFMCYPRQEKLDFDKLSKIGTDLLWTPSSTEMYPTNFQTTITLSEISQVYCGTTRPGHFDGVAGIVTKLFNLCDPQMTFFGEKDFQQLTLLKQLCIDLNFNVQIQSVPTCRETDGLAMSSRNRYLSSAQRQIAPQLYAALTELAQEIPHNRSPVALLMHQKEQTLLEAGFDKIDYLGYCDSETLVPLSSYQENSRLLAAACLGQTRLIDNIAIA